MQIQIADDQIHSQRKESDTFFISIETPMFMKILNKHRNPEEDVNEKRLRHFSYYIKDIKDINKNELSKHQMERKTMKSSMRTI